MTGSLFRHDDVRSPLARATALVRQAWSLRRLRPAVARFYLRALREARRAGDQWTLDVVTRPSELADLLRVARGCATVAEVGTAAAWTTVAFALDEPDRRVLSYDVEAHPERERYLALAAADVRERISLHDRPGGRGPIPAPVVDLVFIDSSHEREETVDTFRTWSGPLLPGGIVAFHDYGDPAYPGVEDAVRELGLEGEIRGRLFVWRKP